jgi:hypothetical protein
MKVPEFTVPPTAETGTQITVSQVLRREAEPVGGMGPPPAGTPR